MPVPVEEIVEFGFGINIVPVPGLLAVHEVDAFTSRDLKSIMVDLSVFESRSPNRYRFHWPTSLAMSRCTPRSTRRFTSPAWPSGSASLHQWQNETENGSSGRPTVSLDSCSSRASPLRPSWRRQFK